MEILEIWGVMWENWDAAPAPIPSPPTMLLQVSGGGAKCLQGAMHDSNSRLDCTPCPCISKVAIIIFSSLPGLASEIQGCPG